MADVTVKDINVQAVETPTYLWGINAVGRACKVVPWAYPVTSVVGLTGVINQADLRTALGLGNAAYLNTGTGAGTVAVGNHTHTPASLGAEAAITSGTSAQYWRGDKVWSTLDKAAVGLNNVDNTADADKPISSATSSALSGKEPTITAGTTGQYWRGDKTWATFPIIQVPIQYNEEGSQVAAAGTASIINFTGAGVDTSFAGNTLTVNVPDFLPKTGGALSGSLFLNNTGLGYMFDGDSGLTSSADGVVNLKQNGTTPLQVTTSKTLLTGRAVDINGFAHGNASWSDAGLLHQSTGTYATASFHAAGASSVGGITFDGPTSRWKFTRGGFVTKAAVELDALYADGVCHVGGVITSGESIEIGGNGTGNRMAYVDLHGDDTYTDYGTRLLRANTGPNANSVFSHRGTGALIIKTEDAGTLEFHTSGVKRAEIGAGGELSLRGTTDEGGELALFNKDNTALKGYLDVDADGHLRLFTISDNTNLRIGQLSGTGGSVSLNAGGQPRVEIASTGVTTIQNSAGFGYGTGSGGTATQITSKNTAVTLNKVCGQIITHGQTMSAGSQAIFVVNCDKFSASGYDTIIVNMLWTAANPANYRIEASGSSANTFRIKITNTSTVALAEALTLNYAIINGSVS